LRGNFDGPAAPTFSLGTGNPTVRTSEKVKDCTATGHFTNTSAAIVVSLVAARKTMKPCWTGQDYQIRRTARATPYASLSVRRVVLRVTNIEKSAIRRQHPYGTRCLKCTNAQKRVLWLFAVTECLEGLAALDISRSTQAGGVC
jgi:hypothetical protein